MTTRSSKIRFEHTQSFTYKYSGNPTNKKALVSSIGRPAYIINKIKAKTETDILPYRGPFGSDGYPLPKGNLWATSKDIPGLGHSTEGETDESVFVNDLGNSILICDYSRDKGDKKLVGYALVWGMSIENDRGNINPLGTLLEGSNLSNSLFGYTGCINYSGNRIAVSELGYNNYTGKVYIYEFDGELGWYILGEPLTGTREMEKFGSSLSFDYTGETIAIGSMGYSVRDNNDNIIQKNVGKVTLYTYDYYEKKWSLYSDMIIKNTMRKNNGFNGGGGVRLNSTGNKLFIGSLKERSTEASLNDESEPYEGLVTVYEKRKVTENEFFNDNTVYRWNDEAWNIYFNNIPLGEFTLEQTSITIPDHLPGGGGGPEYRKFIYDDKNGDGILRFRVTYDPYPDEVDWYIFKGDYENGDVLTKENLIFITSLLCGDLELVDGEYRRRWDFDQILLPEDVTYWADETHNVGNNTDQGSKAPIDILLGGEGNEPNPFIQGETYTLVMADGHGDGWWNEHAGDGARIVLTFDDNNPPARYVYKPERLHWIQHSQIPGPKYIANSPISWTQSPFSGGERAGHISINAFGTRLAIGAPGIKWNGNNGRVRVLQLLNDDSWMQLGNDIVGNGDELGENLDLNRDGTFIVLGSGGAINPHGIVKVYVFHEEYGENWNQIGNTIVGENYSRLGNRNAPNGGVCINGRGDNIFLTKRNGIGPYNEYIASIADPGMTRKGYVGGYRLIENIIT